MAPRRDSGNEALAEFRRPGHVAEEDRDRLASLVRRDGLREAGTALRTELRIRCVSSVPQLGQSDTAGV